MDKLVEKIKDELSKLPGAKQLEDDPELQDALNDIDSSLDQLTEHPHSEGIHSALNQTVEHLQSEGDNQEGASSGILNRLTEELHDYEDSHPGTTLLVSRLANALAVYGL